MGSKNIKRKMNGGNKMNGGKNGVKSYMLTMMPLLLWFAMARPLRIQYPGAV